jgi:hypothetical protein
VKFQKINGQDQKAYILSVNINRRHLTAAQRTMATARLSNRAVAGRGLNESHADPMISAPDHATGQVQSKARYIQLKARRDIRPEWHFHRSSGCGKVTNYAVDGAITKLDDCTF